MLVRATDTEVVDGVQADGIEPGANVLGRHDDETDGSDRETEFGMS